MPWFNLLSQGIFRKGSMTKIIVNVEEIDSQ